MPISVELRDERGCVASDVIEARILTKLIPPLSERSSDLLRFVDPYGDTVFNRLQAGVLAAELRSCSADLLDPVERQAIDSVVELAERCADEVHMYLWFIGD
ncbi:MAG: hypothetical protein U0Q03_00070 [Acidimicrobiales bacterium]